MTKMTAFDALALKGAAWKYIKEVSIGEWWTKTFAEPMKKVLLKTKAERIEVPNLGPVYLRRNADRQVLDTKAIETDLKHLIDSKNVDGGTLKKLFECGALRVGDAVAAGTFCARRMNKPIEGYTHTVKPISTTPELRWPQKPKLEVVYKQLLPVLDFDVKLAHMNKQATMTKIKQAVK